MSSLESQNDAEVQGISTKVKMLKEVCGMLHTRTAYSYLLPSSLPLLSAMKSGTRPRLQSKLGCTSSFLPRSMHQGLWRLSRKMNDSFEASRVRLRGTMNRMLRMAQRSGIGWRVWLVFFLAVFVLFVYVWL